MLWKKKKKKILCSEIQYACSKYTDGIQFSLIIDTDSCSQKTFFLKNYLLILNALFLKQTKT